MPRLPRRRQNPTTPVDLRETEIGLMTAQEFLEHRNPQGKHHDSGSYASDLASLNDVLSQVGTIDDGSRRGVQVYQAPGGALVLRSDQHVAVLRDGTLYHERDWTWLRRRKQLAWSRGYNDRVEVPVLREQLVKYIQPIVEQVTDPSEKNRAEYPHLLQRIRVDGEPMEVRAEAPLVKNKGTTLAILNAAGQVVAKAQDEWGATLIRVAKEVQGKRLGQVLGDLWYETNPRFTSGGFTAAGERSALRIWEARVRELQARGWYTELVRRGDLTKARVAAITAGLKALRARTPTSPLPEPRPTSAAPKRKVLFLIDPDLVHFVIYDQRALAEDEVREEHVFAHGFFRSSEHVGTFLFASSIGDWRILAARCRARRCSTFSGPARST